MYFCISYIGKLSAMPKGRKELSLLLKWKTNNSVPGSVSDGHTRKLESETLSLQAHSCPAHNQGFDRKREQILGRLLIVSAAVCHVLPYQFQSTFLLHFY